jgi:hypothetical protein
MDKDVGQSLMQMEDETVCVKFGQDKSCLFQDKKDLMKSNWHQVAGRLL